MKNIFRKKIFSVIVVMAVSGLLIFFNPYNFFNPARRMVVAFAYPFQKIIFFGAVKIRDSKDLLMSIGKLKKENNDLKENNRILTADLVEMNTLRAENEELRKQLDLLPREKYDLQSAAVIGLDASGSNSWIIIDKGKSDALVSGMPVIVSKGNLIGRIAEVYGWTAKVNLITHPESVINAETLGTSARGIVKGEFGLGVMMDMVVSTEKLDENDKIFTSGLGGDMPRGLYIGTIKEAFITEDGLFRRATVIPAVDYSRLNFVFVIKNNKEG